jgi:Tol biopolymer transport system component
LPQISAGCAHGRDVIDSIRSGEGNFVRLVANTEGRATEPRWSLDGKTIYFTDCKQVDWGVDGQVFSAKLDLQVPPSP